MTYIEFSFQRTKSADIFSCLLQNKKTKTKNKKQKNKQTKKKQLLRDKILQVLVDLYDMQLQIFVFLSYRKHCSNNNSAQPITCTITHIYDWTKGWPAGQLPSAPPYKGC